MKQAYYHSKISEFLVTNEDEIIGMLNKGATAFTTQYTITTTSWDNCIDILKNVLAELVQLYPASRDWHILLEYEIPRLLTRIDIVIIANDLILLVEFKYDRSVYMLEDMNQVLDYKNDLADFHLQSKDRTIIPILLAPKAKYVEQEITYEKGPIDCFKTNTENFAVLVHRLYTTFHDPSANKIDPFEWEKSKYQPTPTIIQAALALFAGQKVENISKSGADATNLSTTCDYLIHTIQCAQQEKKKVVCFVTGVPGAGKTLVGLNIINSSVLEQDGENNAAYFSGNGPLINVLQEALTRDNYIRELYKYKTKQRELRPTKKESYNNVKGKIQNLHQFIRDGIRNKEVLSEKIVVFDEAQRCWNAIQFSTKAKQNLNREKDPEKIQDKSEAELLFEFMDRHHDWAVIIALVGGGQEINTGEAGIAEWGRAIQNKYLHWEVHISPQLLEGDLSITEQKLFDTLPENVSIHTDVSLHLKVCQRSFKAIDLNNWVNAVIDNKPAEAMLFANEIQAKYPLYLTRDINKAKDWLKQKKSGTKRIGLIASSGGLRLKAYGINVREELDEALWFLNDETDVRSSYFLEITATEYKVQGLELDWVGLCWDADLRIENNDWAFKNFSGTNWNNTKSIAEQQFLLNTYRVLMTRAREGMIIFVPEGDSADETRLPQFYDLTYEYLKSCGLLEI